MAHYVSIVNGMTNSQDDDLMSLANDILDGNSGVVGENDYKVTESSPVGMSVTVATGKAYVFISSKSSYYRTLLDAATTLTIDANASGSTRIDIICIKIDTSATPDANASNIASLVVVKGTPGAGVPTTPANHYKLAEVSVANGASSIINANITNKRINLTLVSAVMQFLQTTTPSNPPSGRNSLYFKSDDKLYKKTGAGVESEVGVAPKIVQVVNAAYNTLVIENAQVYTDTGLTATITPTSASNKILVLVSQNGLYKNTSGNYGISLKLLRGAVDIALIGDALFYGITSVTEAYLGAVSICYLDSPATTAATTYKTQFKAYGTPLTVKVQNLNAVSTITLMEIAA